MPRWAPLLMLSLAAAGCDIATGLSDLQFDLPGTGGSAGAGGSGGSGGQLESGTVVISNRPDADILGETRDTYISSATPELNFGAAERIEAGPADGKTALLDFDLDSLDPGFTVVSATLELWTDDCTNCGAIGTFTAYPMLEDWSQGIQNGDNGAASWFLARIDVPWAANGAGPGSHDPNTPLGTATDPGRNEAVLMELDPAVVQAWIDGTQENHGIAIRGTDDEWRIVSSNNASEAMRPQLTLQLVAP